jgi:hypothetical protein
MKFDIIIIDDEYEPPVDDSGYEFDNHWVYKDAWKIIDGEMWIPTAGGMSTEWVRIVGQRLNGNPHIVNTYGWDKNSEYPNLSPPLDWDDDNEGKWSAGVPVTIRGFDYTEYDIEYTEEYEDFADAVKAGKEMSEAYAKST